MTTDGKSNLTPPIADSTAEGERPANSPGNVVAPIGTGTSTSTAAPVAAGGAHIAPAAHQSLLSTGSEKKESWLSKSWGKAALIGGVLVAIANIPGLLNSSVEETGNIPQTVEAIRGWWAGDSRYRGQWTNDAEGILETGLVGLSTRPQPEGVPVDQGSVSIELTVDRGEVSGVISSRTIAERRLHNFMFLSGESSRSGIMFNVWDFHLGEPIVFAHLSAVWQEVDGEGRLLFRTVGQATDIFPNEFFVWRGGSMPTEALNVDLMKSMTAVAPPEPNAESGTSK